MASDTQRTRLPISGGPGFPKNIDLTDDERVGMNAEIAMVWIKDNETFTDMDGEPTHLVASFDAEYDKEWLSSVSIGARFYLQKADSGLVHVGFCEGYTVDKKVSPKKKKRGTRTIPVWVTDLLLRVKDYNTKTKLHDIPADTQITARAIFTEGGKPSSIISEDHRQKLLGKTLHVIDKLQKYEDFRDAFYTDMKLIRRCVHLYLRGQTMLAPPWKHTGPVVLWAAPITSVRNDRIANGEQVGPSHAIVQKLEQSYQSFGFETIIRPKPRQKQKETILMLMLDDTQNPRYTMVPAPAAAPTVVPSQERARTLSRSPEVMTPGSVPRHWTGELLTRAGAHSAGKDVTYISSDDEEDTDNTDLDDTDMDDTDDSQDPEDELVLMDVSDIEPEPREVIVIEDNDEPTNTKGRLPMTDAQAEDFLLAHVKTPQAQARTTSRGIGLGISRQLPPPRIIRGPPYNFAAMTPTPEDNEDFMEGVETTPAKPALASPPSSAPALPMVRPGRTWSTTGVIGDDAMDGLELEGNHATRRAEVPLAQDPRLHDGGGRSRPGGKPSWLAFSHLK